MITEEQLEAALAVLTDEEAAAEVDMTLMRMENQMEVMFDKLFLDAEGPNNEVRKAKARIHPDYQEAKERYIVARGDMKAYQARVNGAEAVRSIFQTQSKNARQSEWIR